MENEIIKYFNNNFSNMKTLNDITNALEKTSKKFNIKISELEAILDKYFEKRVKPLTESLENIIIIRNLI